MIFGFDEFDPLMIIVDEDMMHTDMDEERSTRQDNTVDELKSIGIKEKKEKEKWET